MRDLEYSLEEKTAVEFGCYYMQSRYSKNAYVDIIYITEKEEDKMFGENDGLIVLAPSFVMR